jgi:hypothetical protein
VRTVPSGVGGFSWQCRLLLTAVGGLLRKVLKNIINHLFFSINYYRKLHLQEINLFLMTKDTQDEDRFKEDKSKHRSYC